MDFVVKARLDGLVAAGKFEEAADLLHPLLVQAENAGRQDPALLRQAGLISVGLQDYQGALAYLDAAIRAGDREVHTVGMLADVTHHLKCPQVVIDHISRCAHPMIASRWARTLATLFRFDAAEQVISQMAEPDNDPIVAEVRCIIAVSRYDPNRLKITEDAARNYPSIPQIWGQLAAARQSFGDTQGACAAYREALKMEPEYPAWHYNYALSLLSAGDYRAGFREYEWRMHSAVDRKLVSHLPVNPGGAPLWRGELLAGKKIVMYGEGGIGDVILTLRFINSLLAEGVAWLRVVVPAALVTLCQRMWPNVLFSSEPDATFYAEADYWTPSLTVPERLGMRFSAIPQRKCYVTANPEKVTHWAEKIAAARQRAGKAKSRALVWHGRVEHDYEKTRAFTAAEFKARLPDDVFPVIIQVEATPEELAVFGDEHAGDYLWAGQNLAGFDDTAAVLAACDEHMCCDTSTAHLAGALGLPAKVLIKNHFIWQWKCLPNGQPAWYASPQVEHIDDGRADEIVYARPKER